MSFNLEVMAAMIMFSFVSYERSGAAGYYRTVVNQLLAWLYGGVSYSVSFLTGLCVVADKSDQQSTSERWLQGTYPNGVTYVLFN